MKICSDFAILDVKHGKQSLFKKCKNGERTNVIIYGYIDNNWGTDDGVSREFEVNVQKVEVE